MTGCVIFCGRGLGLRALQIGQRKAALLDEQAARSGTLCLLNSRRGLEHGERHPTSKERLLNQPVGEGGDEDRYGAEDKEEDEVGYGVAEKFGKHWE
jgi:hypothetical protein